MNGWVFVLLLFLGFPVFTIGQQSYLDNLHLTLNSTAKSLLDNVAQQLSSNPDCKVKLVGYGASDKRAQQLSWDHVNAVKTYLTEQKGISETRVIFTYGMDGNGTTVDLVPTTEEGPNTVPAPHPNLRKG